MLVRLMQLSKANVPMLVTGLPSMVSGMISSPVAAVSQSVMVTSPRNVVHVRSSKLAAWRGRNANAKSARRAWSGFMIRQPYHMLRGRGTCKIHRLVRRVLKTARNPVSRTPNRESGYGVKGSGIEIRDTGYLNQEPKKTRLHRYKAGFDCSWIACRFFCLLTRLRARGGRSVCQLQAAR